jgi:hypothetical protein
MEGCVRQQQMESAVDLIPFLYEPNIRYDRTYIGGWKKSKRDGRGVELWRNGDSYEGMFVDGEFDGEGTLKTHGGVYTGSFRKGEKHGRGTMEWKNGDVYDGDWEGDKMHGVGKYEGKDGSSYSGEWASHMRNGRGIHKDKDVSELRVVCL